MTKSILKTKHVNCPVHGGYESNLLELFDGSEVWTVCPKCDYDQRTSDDPDVRASASARRETLAINEHLMDSDIPPRFRPATLENYRTDLAPGQGAVLARCKAYADDFATNWKMGRSMLLLGTMGTGKTYLGCAIIQKVIRAEGMAGAIARYITASDLIRRVKDTFDRKDISESLVYAQMHQPDLLVIDEVGAQHGTDFERQTLFEVINGRYERNLPTILISNLNLDEIRRFIGDRVIDRLCDAGGEVVLFRWPSVRGDV
ncbi:ATP-binding protein [Pseudomonas extremaustralis]|uniref:ATP-binding protein n=1 Tax=Pseudomonas extremaustralis TaxID=359110 RepID=UPI002307EA0F|nr:ATP-binding protein [Pseudomonas extremaustralis]MDB1113564.1 ATP-binding protein [Pseudomonas extremaustralis]